MLCCPAPLFDTVRDDLNADAVALGVPLRTRGRRATGKSGSTAKRSRPSPPRRPAQVPTAGDDPVEPIYGKTYLPRKFKTAFASARRQLHRHPCQRPRFSGRRRGTGGWSATTSWSAADWARPPVHKRRFHSWRVPLCYVDRGDVLKIGEAVLKVFRDFGNRSDRKRARLKYIIHDWGMPAFRAKVEEYLGHPLADPKPVAVSGVDDHLGWHSQGDGKLFLGIPVENGRIKDEGDYRLASGLRAFFEEYQTPARLTCQQ